jgi:hypothetical protein
MPRELATANSHWADPIVRIDNSEISLQHTHEFDCRICGAHLDSQQELDKHRRAKHTVQASPSESGDSSASRPIADPGVDPDLTL